MLRPNLIGKLSRLTGRDINARETYADPIDCPFGPVDMTVKSQRTTVRADSSASRGSADETVSNAVVLIAGFIKPRNGDRFEHDGFAYRIMGTHPRYSVSGRLDHYQCTLEALPA